jgi:hypothetical protein
VHLCNLKRVLTAYKNIPFNQCLQIHLKPGAFSYSFLTQFPFEHAKCLQYADVDTLIEQYVTQITNYYEQIPNVAIQLALKDGYISLRMFVLSEQVFLITASYEMLLRSGKATYNASIADFVREIPNGNKRK